MQHPADLNVFSMITAKVEGSLDGTLTACGDSVQEVSVFLNCGVPNKFSMEFG